MECQVCHGKMVKKSIKLDFWIDDELMVIDNVPGYECRQCGEQIFTPEVTDQIRKVSEEREYEPLEVKLKHFPEELRI